MQKINTTKHTSNSFYLPHHSVRKHDSETTKLKVVFDGPYKNANGISLNELQFVGPTFQDDIYSIIARFRPHRYVLTEVVAKMYRQIWIYPDRPDTTAYAGARIKMKR